MSQDIDTATKEDVARRVAEMQDCPLYEAKQQVRSVLKAMGDLMIEADPERRIELRDFGVFEVKKTKAKPTARNPQTNETVFVPSRRKTLFRPGKRIHDVLKTPLRELGYDTPDESGDELDEDGRESA